MLIAEGKKKERTRNGKWPVWMFRRASQCCPSESIVITSIGQHDRQTDLGRVIYTVRVRSVEDTGRVKKRPEMEKTGKVMIAYYNFQFF